jgi:hypothetical protein
MIAATLSTSLPEFRSLGVLPLPGIPIQYHPAAASIIFNTPQSNSRSFRSNKLLSRLLCRKHVLNIFNHIQPLFSAFLGADLCSQHAPASFYQNRGVGYNHASKIR